MVIGFQRTVLCFYTYILHILHFTFSSFCSCTSSFVVILAWLESEHVVLSLEKTPLLSDSRNYLLAIIEFL